MDRVIIIGCGGSGKSTLARILGEKTGLPVVHLDQIFWSPGAWQHLEKEEFDIRLSQELEKPQWIMDGNFNRTMPMRLEKCDTVIYLDYDRLVCVASWLKRVITNWGKTRADMGPDCNEWIDPEFAKWIWKFNDSYREKYHTLLAQQRDKKIYIFKNRRQLRKFLAQL
jgi:adenylate kinase family enzyme